ncbi:MAG: hypothetical protein KC461_04000 [Dehalococcoidia bacterium]|nr:hypothetical protein [Dehalococcoidia bacterium]MCA9849791.1 hypothetical protein [Dehalococcoidia bacterium]MCB9482909.1 hypothetical protein [Dehalococcoidia bacterium]MCB9491456.1 hypothetical protein [Dehalococcoidia bacterium]
MQQGQKFECGKCGCQIEVTRGPNQQRAGDDHPQCGCGEQMSVSRDP